MARFFNPKSKGGDVDFWGYRKNSQTQQQQQQQAPLSASTALDIENLRRQLSSARSKAMARLEESGGKACLSMERQKPRVPPINTIDAVEIAELPGSIPDQTPTVTPISVHQPQRDYKALQIDQTIPERQSSLLSTPRQSPGHSRQHSRSDHAAHPAFQEMTVPLIKETSPDEHSHDLDIDDCLDLVELERRFGLGDHRLEKKSSKVASMLGVPLSALNMEDNNRSSFALDQPSGKVQHRGLPANNYPRKKRSKVESVLGVSLSSIDTDDKKGERSPKPKNRTPRTGDFRNAMEQKRARHLDLMEVNRALRDAHSISNLNKVIEELQHDLVQRDQMIDAMGKHQKLRSKYNDKYHVENRHETAYEHRQGSFSSNSLRSEGIFCNDFHSSPEPESPDTPLSSYPSSMFERSSNKDHIDAKSFESGYNTFLNMSDPGPLNRPEIFVDESNLKTPTHPQPFLYPLKYSGRRADDQDVPPPSAVLKVLDINEQWADIEMERSPMAQSPEEQSPIDEVDDDSATLMSQADTASLTSFTPYPAPHDSFASLDWTLDSEPFAPALGPEIFTDSFGSDPFDDDNASKLTVEPLEIRATPNEQSEAAPVGAESSEQIAVVDHAVQGMPSGDRVGVFQDSNVPEKNFEGTPAGSVSTSPDIPIEIEPLEDRYSLGGLSETTTSPSDCYTSSSLQTTPKITVEEAHSPASSSSQPPRASQSVQDLLADLPQSHTALYQAIESHLKNSHQRLIDLVNEHVGEAQAAQIAKEAFNIESPLLQLDKMRKSLLPEATGAEAKREQQESEASESRCGSSLSQASEETYVEAMSPWSVMNEKFESRASVANQGLGIQIQ